MGDEELMARAVRLGAAARRRTAPNPWVGCVIARDGTVVGEGASEPPGGAHAEVGALRQAGAGARDATAYVTLEPCSHHGRTPPCADALVEAGLERVVVALEDPDPRVSGQGIARLRDAGIDVHVGPGAHDAALDLAPYLHQRRTGRAWCLVKTAMSLDARTAAADGTSRWITGETARSDAHALRADSQAVVVGSGTALADDPALTVRGVEPAPEAAPLRVLLDARGRVPARGPLFDSRLAPTLVVTTEAAPQRAVDAWLAAGAKVEALEPGAGGTGVDLRTLLGLLGGLGVLQAMVEGGATVHGALLDADLVDHVTAYVAPLVLGDGAKPAFGATGPRTLGDATRYRLVGHRAVGDDVRLDFERAGAEGAG
jgi:diaminohydroxyphosphoribosylaminopyrimidine deaminase/5-amino-6-(5-phosphoribosylamino)uracil reductase